VEVFPVAQALRELSLNERGGTTLGLLYLIVGIVEFLLALIAVTLISYIVIVWSFDPGHHTDHLQSVLFILLLIVLLCYPAPSIVAGFGLWKQRKWSAVWVWVATILHLINIPIGTLVGGYGLWVLLKSKQA